MFISIKVYLYTKHKEQHMKVISLIGQKGGTGKTTLAEILAVSFHSEGYETLGIDLDPQTSLSTWGDMREAQDPRISSAPYSRIKQTLEFAKGEGVEVVIIDTAGRAEIGGKSAAENSDLVILPFQPTSADLMTVSGAQDTIQLAKSPEHFAVLTRVKPQGTRHLETMDFLKVRGIAVCPHTIGDRVTYQDAAACGLVPSFVVSHPAATITFWL